MMRLPIVCALLMVTVLGGCGVSEVRTPQGLDSTAELATAHAATIAAASPTLDRAALQQAVDQISNEATIVGATVAALHSDGPVDPVVATTAAQRYQDNIAAIMALQPTLIALTTPLAEPHISDAARAAADAAYGAAAARAAANAASITPVAGQSTEEAGLMQRATIAAATMIALGSGAPVDPAVATAAVTYYQDTNATIAASQPTSPPLPPTTVGPTATSVPTPDIQSAPVAPAPSHLAGITLPTTQQEMEALSRNMPPAVAGQDRTPNTTLSGQVAISYGTIALSTAGTMPRILLLAMDQAPELSTPGWTGAHVIVAMATQSPERINAWGRDGHVYWMRVAGPVDPQHTNPNQMLLIGTDASTWVFQLIATSPEELDALGAALAGALEARH